MKKVGTTFKVFIPDSNIQSFENEQFVNNKKTSQLKEKNQLTIQMIHILKILKPLNRRQF